MGVGEYRTIRLGEIGLPFVIGPGGTIAVRLLEGPTRTKSGREPIAPVANLEKLEERKFIKLAPVMRQSTYGI